MSYFRNVVLVTNACCLDSAATAADTRICYEFAFAQIRIIIIPFWLKLHQAACLVAPLLSSPLSSPQVGIGGRSNFRVGIFIYMDLPQTNAGVPASGIDPTVEERAAFTGLAGIFDWLGISAATRTSLVAALGGGQPQMRDVVYIKGGDWDQAIRDLVIPAPEGQGEARGPTPFELGHFAMVRRIARLRFGFPANEAIITGPISSPFGDLSQGLGQPSQSSQLNTLAVPPNAPASTEPKTKLSVILDPSMGSDLVRLPHSKVRALANEYAIFLGAEAGRGCGTHRGAS